MTVGVEYYNSRFDKVEQALRDIPDAYIKRIEHGSAIPHYYCADGAAETGGRDTRQSEVRQYRVRYRKKHQRKVSGEQDSEKFPRTFDIGLFKPYYSYDKK